MTTISNSIYSIFNRGYNVVYQMLTGAYISRIFLADGVGEVMFAINIVAYFVLAASLGIPNYAVKVLAPVRENQIALNKRFSELAFFIFISSLVASFLYYIVISFLFHHNWTNLMVSYALGLMVLSNVFNYDWLFESLEKFKYLAYRSIIVRTIALLLMFFMVKSREDVLIYCLIYACCTVMNNLWNFLVYRQYVNLSFSHLNFRRHISPVLILFSATFATEIYTLLDSTMLGFMCSKEHLGYYSNASKVSRACFYIIFAAITVFNPKLNYLYRNCHVSEYKNMLIRFYEAGMCLAIPITAVLFIFAPKIMPLMFGEAFIPGIQTLRILSPLIVIFTLAYVFGHVCLIIYGKEKSLFYAAILGAVSNFLLNQWLIPVYTHNGAALASLVSESLVASFLFFVSMNCCKVKLFTKKVSMVLLVTIIICAGWVWVHNQFY